MGLILTLSCVGPSPDPSPVGIQVQWGLTGSSALPSVVDQISITTCFVGPPNGEDDDMDGLIDEAGEENCDSNSCTISVLTLMTEFDACRPSMGTEMFDTDPVLVLQGLATDTPIRFQLSGQDAAGATVYVGMAGPFVLGTGERRLVTITMWPVGAATTFPGASIGRSMHTTSWLPDGRLLVAGGFDRISPTTCPAEMMLPDGSSCFDLVATATALAIDVASGRIEPIRNSMLMARGGHTATTLPDGRILLAGGAPRAMFALVPMGGMTSGRFRSVIVPQNLDGTDGAHDTFEVFDAFIGHETDDPDRDGDPGRGGFFGTDRTSAPGALNEPRFMHAATTVPSTSGRVVLVGGMGGDDSSQTWEVFDANKPGGLGFYRASTNRLAHARPQPGAVGLQGQVWIFGGRLAEDNEQLAEVWQAGMDDPNGAVQLATEAGEFPSSAPATPEDHPEFSLHAPVTAAIAGSSRALVVGWYGAQCESGSMMPRFFDAMTPSEFCNAPTSPITRSFTVNGLNGITTPTEVRPHAFGAVTELTDFEQTASSRRVVITGGIANFTWAAQRVMDVFTGAVDASGAATRSPMGMTLSTGRFFHTSTGFSGRGVVTVGGLSYDSISGNLRMVDTVEIFFIRE